MTSRAVVVGVVVGACALGVSHRAHAGDIDTNILYFGAVGAAATATAGGYLVSHGSEGSVTGGNRLGGSLLGAAAAGFTGCVIGELIPAKRTKHAVMFGGLALAAAGAVLVAVHADDPAAKYDTFPIGIGAVIAIAGFTMDEPGDDPDTTITFAPMTTPDGGAGLAAVGRF